MSNLFPIATASKYFSFNLKSNSFTPSTSFNDQQRLYLEISFHKIFLTP